MVLLNDGTLVNLDHNGQGAVQLNTKLTTRDRTLNFRNLSIIKSIRSHFYSFYISFKVAFYCLFTALLLL